MPSEPYLSRRKLSHPVKDLRKEVLRHFQYGEYPPDRPSLVELWLPESSRTAWQAEADGWADRMLLLLGAPGGSRVEVLFFEEFRGEILAAAGDLLSLRLENERAELSVEAGPQHLVEAPRGPLTGARVRALRLRRLDGREAYRIHLEADLCLS